MGNTNTSHDSALLASALAGINEKFRTKIIKEYLLLKERARRSQFNSDFDSSGISSGKFCETVFRFLEFELKGGVFTPFKNHINNLAKELNGLELIPKTLGNESLRVLIPRALIFIYTIRNKRGIGHVGGDVEANFVDLSTIVKTVDWVIIELIRIYHSLSLEEAQTIVETLSTRAIPEIWEINGKKRILKKGLDYKDKVLLLTYNEVTTGTAVEDLFEWLEYSNLSVFKKNVLFSLHSDGLIEFDKELDYVHLSPLGIREVEERILSR
jgi:hypothetical protein